MNSKSFAFLALLATLTTTLPAWADIAIPDEFVTALGDDNKMQANETLDVGGKLTLTKAIDLNGHSLTLTGVSGMTGAFSITNSVGDGVLDIEVTKDVTQTGTFDGMLKLIKRGAGLLSVSMNQSYNGGTEIHGGSLYPKDTSPYAFSNAAYNPYGDRSTSIKVYSGGRLSIRASTGWASNYPIELYGGAISNIQTRSGQSFSADNIKLHEDSTYYNSNNFGLSATFDLNDHTLTIQDDYNGIMNIKPNFHSKGKVVVKGTYSMTLTGNIDMPIASLKVETPVNLSGKTWTVLDYEYAAEKASSDGTGAVVVNGTFKPTTDCFFPPTMMDGSTIDLSAKEGPWAAGATVFANGATIAIEVGARTDLVEGSRLVTWSETEYNGRTFNLTSSGVFLKDLALQPQAGGLVVVSTSAKIPTAVWKGDKSADALDPENWDWGDAEDHPNLPNGTYVVEIAWNKLPDLNWPETDALDYASLVFTGDKPSQAVALADDRDWRGLGAMDIPFALDLNGHKLYILLPDAESTVETTVTSSAEGGELHASVAAGKTYDNTMVTLTGNLTLIKEGQGTFVATKYPQEYAGESIVNEGTLRAADGANMNAEDKASPFGATATVTVGAEGVLDPRGSYLWGYHTINLNGGMISNTLEKTGLSSDQYAASTENQFNPTINLTTDSILATDRKFNFQGKFNSNGNRLRIWIASGCTLVWNPDDKTADAADIEVVAGGYLRTFSHGPVKTKHSSLTMTSGYLHIGGVFEVSNYLAASSAKTYKYDSRQASNESVAFLKVYGTFTPQSDNFFACSLQDGSAIDLSGKSGVWSTATEATASSVTSSYKGTKTDVDFAAGATVTIDVGDREFKGTTQIVEWSEGSKASAAEATFVLSAAARAKGYSLSSDENGLYVSRKGMVLLLR